MSKQYHRTAFCSCGAQFQARDRWQRSCEKCLAARAAAEAAQPPRACIRCGSTGNVSNRLCPSCREAKERALAERLARSEARKLARYGTCARHPDKFASHDGVCWLCHEEKVRERRQADYWREQDAEREREEERAIADRYASMDEDGRAFFKLLMFLSGRTVPDYIRAVDKAERAPTVEEVSPEQQPHADQDAIDAAFRQLMDGVL